MAYCAGLCGFEILHFLHYFWFLGGILKHFLEFFCGFWCFFLIVFWGVFRVWVFFMDFRYLGLLRNLSLTKKFVIASGFDKIRVAIYSLYFVILRFRKKPKYLKV